MINQRLVLESPRCLLERRRKIIRLANPPEKWSYRKNNRVVHVLHYGIEGLKVGHVRHAIAEAGIPILSNILKAAFGYSTIPRIHYLNDEIERIDEQDKERFIAIIFAKSRLAGIQLQSFNTCVCYTLDQLQVGPYIDVGPQISKLISIGAVRDRNRQILIEDPRKAAWVTIGSDGNYCVTNDRAHASYIHGDAINRRILSKATGCLL